MRLFDSIVLRGPSEPPGSRRVQLAVGAALVFVVALSIAAASSAPEPLLGTRAPNMAEQLVYRVGAKLAASGIRSVCHGVEVHPGSLRLHIAECELANRRGLLRARDISLGFALAPTWLPLTHLPSLSVRVGDLAVVRAKQPPKTAAAAGSAAPRRSLPVPVQFEVDALHVSGMPAVRAAGFGYPLAARPSGHAQFETEQGAAKLAVRRQGDGYSAHVVARGLSLGGAARALGLSLPIVSGGAALLADLEYERGVLLAKAAAQMHDLCLEHRRFGEGRACGVGAGGAVRFGADASRVFVDAARFTVGARQRVLFTASGTIPRQQNDAAAAHEFVFSVPEQSVAQVLDAIPAEWRTGLHGFELGGGFSAEFRLGFAASEFSIDPSFRFHDVVVKNAPMGQDPRRLNGPVTWRMPFPYAHTVVLSPERGYTPLSAIPPLLVDAVRISEDASFYGHDGFDRGEIARALVDIKEGNGARGASTISQQLAKNLYFDGDRNLTRKVEEAVATAALEASVPKWRLLEIYLNIIEWGDGIFGIEQAAAHYFKKPPISLTPSEAAFLAGIIPAPRKVDRDLRRDGVSPWADKRQLRVTRFLCDVGKLDGAACSAPADASELSQN